MALSIVKEKSLIYCCTCKKAVQARLTGGFEIFPLHEQVSNDPFWVCDSCKNYVACHHKTPNVTTPIGCIANKEIRDYRKKIHLILDPLFKKSKRSRKNIYSFLSKTLNYNYHTANIKSIEEAKSVLYLVTHNLDLLKSL